jgi:hypothetical protein
VLTSTGLFQLTPSASGPVGTWVAVSANPRLAGDELTEEHGPAPHLYFAGGRLYAMGAFGETVRYQPPTCAQ